MTKAYSSKNSEYILENNNLFRAKNGKKANIGLSVYTSKESLEELLRKYKIPAKKRDLIKIEIGDKFFEELKTRSISLENIGGRFVALEEQAIGYVLFYSGEIKETKEGDSSGDTQINLGSDSDLKVADKEIDIEGDPFLDKEGTGDLVQLDA